MRKSEATERMILQASLELFVRKGYHGTSIDDIMRRVNLSKGALYAHFKSKSELLFRIIEEYETQFLDELIRSVDAYEGSALDKLRQIIKFYTSFGDKNMELSVFLTFLTTELNADADFQPVLKRTYRRYRSYIADIIQSGITEGLIRRDVDPDLAALTFIAIADGTLHQWILNRDNLDGIQFIRTFQSIFIRGISAEKN